MRYRCYPSVGLLASVALVAGALPAQGRSRADTTRKDYSAPLGAPYTAQDVTIPTPMGHALAGTLTLPTGASATNKVGAVVTEGLVRRKYTDRQIEGIVGGNFRRVLTEIWTVPPRAR